MRKFNISVPRTYTKNGQEKKTWKTVGTLVHFPATQEKEEGYILELHMYPDTYFGVFEDKPKQDQYDQRTNESYNQVTEENISQEDLDVMGL
jgi:hypothetical protein